MRKNPKIIFLIYLLIVMIIPHVYAVTDYRGNTDSHGEEIRGPPVVFFDNFSRVNSWDDKEKFPVIPSKIKKYDILEITVKTLEEQILAGQKIPVHINGTPYLMNLQKGPVTPSDKSGELSFIGHLEGKSDNEIQDYIVHLTIFGDAITGSIYNTRSQSFFYIQPLHSLQSNKTLHYVYASTDVVNTGARMDNDVWIILPSGESKLRNDLSSEELAWYINEQIKQENSSHENLSMTGPEATSLPVTIAVIAFGVCAVIVRCFGRK
ncbi:MAG: hypothetical protein Q7T80_05220 [Methanoregula sp.]|nr:hypothetical protein [Methanoregula sp.]